MTTSKAQFTRVSYAFVAVVLSACSNGAGDGSNYRRTDFSIELPSPIIGTPIAIPSSTPSPVPTSSPSPTPSPSPCVFSAAMQVVDQSTAIGAYTSGYAMGTSRFGVGLFSVGSAYPTNIANEPNRYEWTVRRSLDSGATWTVANQFRLSDTGEYSNATHTVSFANGDIFAGGIVTNVAQTTFRTIVRRSSNQGALWTIVEDITGELKYLGADHLGNIYEVIDTHQTPKRVLVRISQNRGVTWSQLDALAYDVQAVFTDTNLNIYVAGTDQGRLIVRRSANSGATWQIVSDLDSLSLVGTSTATFGTFVEDEKKALYVSVGGFLVLRSTDQGVSWTVANDARMAGFMVTRILTLFKLPQGGIGSLTSHSIMPATITTDRWVVRGGYDAASWRTIGSGANSSAGGVYLAGSADATADLYLSGYNGNSWLTSRLKCR